MSGGRGDAAPPVLPEMHAEVDRESHEGQESGNHEIHGVVGTVPAKALDLRTRHMNGQGLQAVYHKLKEELGEQFDVVLESDHIHLEYQPKTKSVEPEER